MNVCRSSFILLLTEIEEACVSFHKSFRNKRSLICRCIVEDKYFNVFESLSSQTLKAPLQMSGCVEYGNSDGYFCHLRALDASQAGNLRSGKYFSERVGDYRRCFLIDMIPGRKVYTILSDQFAFGGEGHMRRGFRSICKGGQARQRRKERYGCRYSVSRNAAINANLSSPNDGSRITVTIQ